jgi:Flp pilus assembly protein TadD
VNEVLSSPSYRYQAERYGKRKGKRRARGARPLLLLLAIVGFWGNGCASRYRLPMPLKPGAYHQILQQQKAGMAGENETRKALPPMTAADYEMMGDTYLRQRDLGMALVQYTRALGMHPSSTRLRYKIGLLFLSKGLVKDAMHAFQDILRDDPHYALAYEGLGLAFFKINKFKKAEKHFLKAIDMDNTLWQSYNFLGIIYDKQHRFDESIAIYRKAIDLNKYEWLIYNNLGICFFHKKAYNNAVDAFMKALKNGSNNKKIYNNLGLALGKLGRYQEALEAFIKGGGEAKAHNNLGVIYLAAGKYRRAIAAFEKAIELQPRYYTTASENLTMAQQALGARLGTASPPVTAGGEAAPGSR